MSISSISSTGALPSLQGLGTAASNPIGGTSSGSAISFQDVLRQSLFEAGRLEQESQQAVLASLAGDDVSQVEVLTAAKKADLALRTMVQLRNKVLDAYNELKNMRM